MIDPVESCLAVMGVRPILSKEVERFTRAKYHEMQALPRELRTLARDVCRGEKMRVPLGSVNYKAMLHDLTEGYDEAQVIAMVQTFPPELHELSAEFIVKAGEVVTLLRGLLPLATKETLLGPENLPPSAIAVRRFATALEVLDDPRRVFALIATGSLLKSQVAVARKVYPTLSAAIDDELEEAAVSMRAEKKSYRLPPKVEIGVGTWRGFPRVSASLRQALQDSFAQADQQQPAPPRGDTSIAAHESLTGTQKSLYPQT